MRIKASAFQPYHASTLPIPSPDEIVTNPPLSKQLWAQMLAERGDWRKGDESLERFVHQCRCERRERRKRARLKKVAAVAEAARLAQKKRKYLRRVILLERLQEVRTQVDAWTEGSLGHTDSLWSTSDVEDEREAAAGRY
ncbi:hypothetical protein B0H11DRAFT_2218272 [Mycena galericulata]|nr:hypothetical protein B0H11DRAFT_2218272 [Mycena galericulata]